MPSSLVCTIFWFHPRRALFFLHHPPWREFYTLFHWLLYCPSLIQQHASWHWLPRHQLQPGTLSDPLYNTEKPNIIIVRNSRTYKCTAVFALSGNKTFYHILMPKMFCCKIQKIKFYVKFWWDCFIHWFMSVERVDVESKCQRYAKNMQWSILSINFNFIELLTLNQAWINNNLLSLQLKKR